MEITRAGGGDWPALALVRAQAEQMMEKTGLYTPEQLDSGVAQLRYRWERGAMWLAREGKRAVGAIGLDGPDTRFWDDGADALYLYKVMAVPGLGVGPQLVRFAEGRTACGRTSSCTPGGRRRVSSTSAPRPWPVTGPARYSRKRSDAIRKGPVNAPLHHVPDRGGRPVERGYLPRLPAAAQALQGQAARAVRDARVRARSQIRRRKMDKLASKIQRALQAAFPDADVVPVPLEDGELRTVHLHVRGNTAPQIEAAALAEAREFFGPGPELHVEDGWHASKLDSADKDGNWYAPVGIDVHAHGELAGPDDDPGDANRRRYPAEEVPGPDTLPEPEGKPDPKPWEQHSDQE
jgi:hypothetical protein